MVLGIKLNQNRKKIYDQIFDPEILHMKSALNVAIFTHKETAEMH